MKVSSFLVGGWALFCAFAMAEAIDGTTLKALEETQSLMNNPVARSQAAQASPDAAQADAALQALAGNAQNTQAMYELASEILADLTKAAGGDPAKMQRLLESAKSNPEAFASALSPSARKKLEELAKTIKAPAATKLP